MIKCRCVCTQGPAGAMTRLRTPPCLSYSWDSPVQTPAMKPGHLSHLCRLCWVQGEAERPTSSSSDPGAHWAPSPIQGTGTMPRAESWRGIKGETAIASNPEQKTGVSTVWHQKTDLGSRSAGTMAPTCVGECPVPFLQGCQGLCVAGSTAPWVLSTGGSSALEGRSLHSSLRAIQQGGGRRP